MDDLEATWLCAEAMGHKVSLDGCDPVMIQYREPNCTGWIAYDPLHADAQAMALVKRFRLWIGSDAVEPRGIVWTVDRGEEAEDVNEDLNRAIVYCVAKMRLGAKRERNDSQQEKS